MKFFSVGFKWKYPQDSDWSQTYTTMEAASLTDAVQKWTNGIPLMRKDGCLVELIEFEESPEWEQKVGELAKA